MPDQKEPQAKIQHEQQEQDLESLAANGHDMLEMVQTQGWQRLMAPVYGAKLESLKNEFLGQKHTYEEFVRIQQEWLATQAVLGRVIAIIQAGENAAEQLAEKRKQEAM